mmetsp:Transcript_23729/g.35837  ORF Transcript_23729/g.35837 Transcript_23729/m.35837 type:complete len:270 (+) Transcript_23729:439-1248(+)
MCSSTTLPGSRAVQEADDMDQRGTPELRSQALMLLTPSILDLRSSDMTTFTANIQSQFNSRLQRSRSVDLLRPTLDGRWRWRWWQWGIQRQRIRSNGLKHRNNPRLFEDHCHSRVWSFDAHIVLVISRKGTDQQPTNIAVATGCGCRRWPGCVNANTMGRAIHDRHSAASCRNDKPPAEDAGKIMRPGSMDQRLQDCVLAPLEHEAVHWVSPHFDPLKPDRGDKHSSQLLSQHLLVLLQKAVTQLLEGRQLFRGWGWRRRCSKLVGLTC